MYTQSSRRHRGERRPSGKRAIAGKASRNGKIVQVPRQKIDGGTEREAAAVLPVVEDEVEPSDVVDQGGDSEGQEDPADRVSRLRPRDHVADAAVGDQQDEDEPVVRGPRIACDHAERHVGDEQHEQQRSRDTPDELGPQDHERNLRLPRYGIVTRRNDPGTEQE